MAAEQQSRITVEQLIGYWQRTLTEDERKHVLDIVLKDQDLYEQWLVVADLVREGHRQAEQRTAAAAAQASQPVPQRERAWDFEWTETERSRMTGPVLHELPHVREAIAQAIASRRPCPLSFSRPRRSEALALATPLGSGGPSGVRRKVQVRPGDCQFAPGLDTAGWTPLEVVIVWLPDGTLEIVLDGFLMPPPGGTADVSWETAAGRTSGSASDSDDGVAALSWPEPPASGDRLVVVRKDAAGETQLRWEYTIP